MSKINLQIGKLRRAKGMTQQELGEKLGVSFQTVSKWETNVTMPDITVLPELAALFGVSVDALLGLVNLEEYQPALNGRPEFWGERVEYLKRSRSYMWNEDYLRHLVENVWKIHRPVRILDCGCAYGAVGMMLLPFLPKGSTYTGVDHSEKLLEEGRLLYADQGMEATFVQSDSLDFCPEKMCSGGLFDLVISQAVLRHSDCAQKLVEKMAAFVKPGGLLVAIDCNREFEESGVYLDGEDYADLSCHEGMRKLWKTEWEKQGRDFAAAMKAPHYMRRAGLKNVEVRMNDRVNYLAPDQESYTENLADFRSIKGWNVRPDYRQQEEIANVFLNRGMERADVDDYFRRQEQCMRYFEDNPETAALCHVWGFMISFGWK